jgi:pyrroline-5-carboxylate reductase
MATVTASIRDAVASARATVLSIAAGITVASLEQGLGDNTSIVRCMPNTPALLRSGAAAMFANDAASPAQRHLAEAVLGAVGTVCWVEREADLDTVTALSGSGPAYFFLMLEAMTATAQRMGLDAQTSRALAAQTALGAARMVLESEDDVAELRRRVTSPGGTTQAAVEYFENAGFRDMVDGAMSAAAERSRELSREME